MATIKNEFTIIAPPDVVWKAIRDFGNPVDLFPGVLTESQLEGNARVVRFANGLVVREQLVTVDDQARRLVWNVVEGPTTHFNGALQVFSVDDRNSRVVWIADFLPDTAKDSVSQLIGLGVAAMKRTLEKMNS